MQVQSIHIMLSQFQFMHSPYTKSAHLSCAHNTIELFAAVVRRALQSTTVSFNMVKRSTSFICFTVLNCFQVFVNTFIDGTLKVTLFIQDSAYVHRLERLCDVVARLESFAGSDKEQNSLFREYHGKTLKMSVVPTQPPH